VKDLLLRRRQVWLPTLWGWLVLLALLGGVALLFARCAHAFLAPNEPARGKDGAGARTLIVEGWMDEAELAQAIAVFRRGHYQRVLTTGGPVESWAEALPWKTFADRGASYLTSHGLSEVPVVAVPAPASAQDRSFLSAVMVGNGRSAMGWRSTRSTSSRPAFTPAARASCFGWRLAPAWRSARSRPGRETTTPNAGGRPAWRPS
jgi:hypothetical protein